MSIAENIRDVNAQLNLKKAKLVVVSKTQPIDNILQAYQAGNRLFGENQVQELHEKQPLTI